MQRQTKCPSPGPGRCIGHECPAYPLCPYEPLPQSEGFGTLGFRGTTWYLAEDVDKKLDAIKNWYLENGPFNCDIYDLTELGKILRDEG